MNKTEKKFLTIIPARKGSRRVPNKNIRPLAGVPLIEWTFKACASLDINQDVFVSTNCEKIQESARSFGLLCPELRPEELAQDLTSTADVVHYIIRYCQKNLNCIYENILLLQPTSPLRSSRDIKEAISLFTQKSADAIQSYTPAECPPMWINTIEASLQTDDFIPQNFKNIRSQDLGQFYRINGAIYIIKASIFLEKSSFLVPNSFAYIMPRSRSIDIDDEYDFIVADLMALHAKNYPQIASGEI